MVLLHLYNLFLHLGSSRFPLWPYLSDWSQTTTCGIQLSRWRHACIGFWKYFPYWTTKSDSGCNFFCSLTTKPQITNHSTSFNHSLSKIVYYLNLLYIVVLQTFQSWVVSFQSLVTKTPNVWQWRRQDIPSYQQMQAAKPTRQPVNVGGPNGSRI